MDLEGYCRRELASKTPEKEILKQLSDLIIKIKFSGEFNETSERKANALAEDVLHEVLKTNIEIKNGLLCPAVFLHETRKCLNIRET